jgi:hypothetical protein
MSEEIIKVLDNLAQKFGIAIDWTNQNIMPYLQELMGRYQKYIIAWNSVILFMGIAFLIITILCFVSGLKEKKQDKYWEWTDEGLGKFIAMLFFGILALVIIPITLDYILKGIFVPEVLILNILKG